MQKVLVENNADGTTLITINREARRNAICAETALLLQQAFQEFERSPTQKAAVITGAGNEAFSGGADIDIVTRSFGSGIRDVDFRRQR